MRAPGGRGHVGGAVLVLALAVTTGFAQAPADSTRLPTNLVGPGDTLTTSRTPAAAGFTPFALPASPFAVVGHERFAVRHAVSLDHWLERLPGHLLTRRGPLGKDAAFSRWGMGRGRALVLIDGVPFNDPQTGGGPLAHMPLSGLDRLLIDHDDGSGVLHDTALEGSIELRERPAGEESANAFLEVSNGDRRLRQRRVRFASVRSTVALDLGYDELLNDGYWFDATETIPFVQGVGRTQSRHVSARLRGEFDEGERWSVGFRRYVGDSQGDRNSATSEHRRSGHLATMRASFERVELTAFERGFDVGDPDSNTVNSTRGAYATVHAVQVRRAVLTVKAGVEDIAAEQRVGTGISTNGLRKIAFSGEGGANLGERTALRIVGSWAGHWRRDGAWGVAADLRHELDSHAVVATLRRSFRLPSLGELFVPVHTREGRTLAGNHLLGDEHAWEAGLRAESRLRGFTNDVRATAMRVQDPIAFRPDPARPSDWRVASNGGNSSVVVVEERAELAGDLGALEVRVDGGLAWALGEREGYFRSVPKVRAVLSSRVGSQLFEGTSALYLNVDWVTTGARSDYDGQPLSRYDVFNVMISGRLVNALLYLGMLNVSDERYTTQGNDLMMPRTLVYGISWSLRD